MSIQALSDIVRASQSAFAAGGGGGVHTGDTAPVDPAATPIWITLAGRLYFWDGSVWFEFAGPSGAGAVIHTVSLDFGPVSVPSKTFTFAHAGALVGARVLMNAASPGAGRDFDEMEMDSLTCAAVCLSAGVITATVVAYPGPVSGAYNFNYQLG
jgi:hypothetical protein